MTQQRGILLASFLTGADEDSITNEVNYIVNNMNLTNDYVFLLRNQLEPTKVIITYNAIVARGSSFHPHLYTMRVHRKKQTNTLYTINALNAAVAEQHDGKTGRDLKLDWEHYRNSLLLTVGKKLQVHPIEVIKIFKIEDPPEEN
tara:strand:+ start:1831 stop:2265 length:435 start_codon:yes stop_codon:yes gene_type:complete